MGKIIDDFFFKIRKGKRVDGHYPRLYSPPFHTKNEAGVALDLYAWDWGAK